MDSNQGLGPLTQEQFDQMMNEYDAAARWMIEQLRRTQPAHASLPSDEGSESKPIGQIVPGHT